MTTIIFGYERHDDPPTQHLHLDLVKKLEKKYGSNNVVVAEEFDESNWETAVRWSKHPPLIGEGEYNRIFHNYVAINKQKQVILTDESEEWRKGEVGELEFFEVMNRIRVQEASIRRSYTMKPPLDDFPIYDFRQDYKDWNKEWNSRRERGLNKIECLRSMGLAMEIKFYTWYDQKIREHCGISEKNTPGPERKLGQAPKFSNGPNSFINHIKKEYISKGFLLGGGKEKFKGNREGSPDNLDVLYEEEEEVEGEKRCAKRDFNMAENIMRFVEDSSNKNKVLYVPTGAAHTNVELIVKYLCKKKKIEEGVDIRSFECYSSHDKDRIGNFNKEEKKDLLEFLERCLRCSKIPVPKEIRSPKKIIIEDYPGKVEEAANTILNFFGIDREKEGREEEEREVEKPRPAKKKPERYSPTRGSYPNISQVVFGFGVIASIGLMVAGFFSFPWLIAAGMVSAALSGASLLVSSIEKNSLESNSKMKSSPSSNIIEIDIHTDHVKNLSLRNKAEEGKGLSLSGR